MASTISEKELKTDWPMTEGLIAETTKQTGRQTNLTPEGLNNQITTVLTKDRKLL